MEKYTGGSYKVQVEKQQKWGFESEMKTLCLRVDEDKLGWREDPRVRGCRTGQVRELSGNDVSKSSRALQQGDHLPPVICRLAAIGDRTKESAVRTYSKAALGAILCGLRFDPGWRTTRLFDTDRPAPTRRHRLNSLHTRRRSHGSGRCATPATRCSVSTWSWRANGGCLPTI